MKQNNFIVFLFGIIFAQQIFLIGNIYIGEIISSIYLLFNFIKLRYTNFEKKLIFFTFFTTILHVFVNFYHEVDLNNNFKGTFSYIVFTSVIIFLCRYLKQENSFKSAIFFFIGIIAGKFISYLYIENLYFLSNPWKWGIGGALIKLVLIIPLFDKKDFSKLFFFIFSIAIVYFSLLYNSRAMLFVYGLSFIIYLLVYNSQKYNLKFFNKKSSFMLLPLSCFFIVLILGLAIVQFTPAQSFLANFKEMAEKNYEQGQGQFGVVVSARSDLISAFYAFKDRPLLGHGSYPEDKNLQYRMKQLDFLYKFNYVQVIPHSSQIDRFLGRKIPTHSFLFDAIIAVGLLGSLFWIFLTYFIVKNYANYSNDLPFFFHFAIVSYFFSLFFSPWAAGTRFSLAIVVVLFILYIELLKEINQNNKIKK